MSTSGSPRLRVPRCGEFLAGLALTLTGCSPSADILPQPTGGGTGGGTHLVSSASKPDTGNATLTAGGTLTLDAGGGGFDELALEQMVGDTTHEVAVTWDTTTHALHGASHTWGPEQSHGDPGSGFTACLEGFSPCDPQRVLIDFEGHVVTFQDLVLPDAFGGDATSTLTGTVGW